MTTAWLVAIIGVPVVLALMAYILTRSRHYDRHPEDWE